jgi:hypothetical protein
VPKFGTCEKWCGWSWQQSSRSWANINLVSENEERIILYAKQYSIRNCVVLMKSSSWCKLEKRYHYNEVFTHCCSMLFNWKEPRLHSEFHLCTSLRTQQTMRNSIPVVYKLNAYSSAISSLHFSLHRIKERKLNKQLHVSVERWILFTSLSINIFCNTRHTVTFGIPL